MTTTCVLAQSQAEAVSTTVEQMVVVSVSQANATSSVTPSVTPQGTVNSVANVTSAVQIEAYAVLMSGAQATGAVSASLVVTDILNSVAAATSSATQFLTQLAISTANAEDEIASADVPQLLTSVANALASAAPGTVSTMLLTSEGASASSFSSIGLGESVVSAAGAQSSAIILRRVGVTVTSYADGTSTTEESGTPEEYLLVSVGNAASLVTLGSTETLLLSATADAASSAWYADPDLKAWVMNTETTAVSWYDNFGFESMTQVQGRTFAAGEDGIYEVTGGTDAGTPIEAVVEPGFTDFGADYTKRLDAMYFGYTSEGQIAVQAEVYESGHQPTVYLLEQRAAGAPRNSRVTPGKGLWGRYWRLTISNVDGADFEVHDASVDIAVSSRRI